MGNWATKNNQNYFNVRIVADAKFFPEKQSGDRRMPAAAFVTFYHGTKGGEDLPVDAQFVRGSALAANLKKGDIINVTGELGFKNDRNGKLRGIIYNADYSTLVKLKDRTTAQEESAESGGGLTDVATDTDAEGMGPAFD